MGKLVSNRLELRNWLDNDWRDLLELSINWKAQPGPEFDKFPVTEEECKKFNDYNVKNGNSYAVYLTDAKKVIGLIGLNGKNEKGEIDLGHVIHSKYLDSDIDKEALYTIIEHIFNKTDAKAIITNNDPNEKQNAALYSLGFKPRNKNGGQLIMEKHDWRK